MNDEDFTKTKYKSPNSLTYLLLLLILLLFLKGVQVYKALCLLPNTYILYLKVI